MPKLGVRLAVALSLLALGCQPGALRVEPVATSIQRPSQVAVYVAITRGGQPVPNLTLSNFRVYEDGQELGSSETQLVLLPRALAVEHRTLLLVDITGAKTESERRLLSQAAARFVRSVRSTQTVSVYAFDGAATIRKVEEFPQTGVSGEPASIDALEKLETTDRSRNLNGAVREGLRELDGELLRAEKPVRVGSLVVFTAGPDIAGRVKREQLDADLERTRHHVFAVAVGDASKLRLTSIGRAGVVRIASPSAAPDAFDRAAKLVTAMYGSHYLLAYCSPARGGVRELRIEVQVAGPNQKQLRGRSDLDFSAEGFEAGCRPQESPRFVVTLVSSDDGSVPGLTPPPPPEPEPEPTPEPVAEATPEPEAAPAPKPKRRVFRGRPRVAPTAKPAPAPAPPPATAPPSAKPKEPAKPAEPGKPAPSPPGDPPDFEP